MNNQQTQLTGASKMVDPEGGEVETHAVQLVDVRSPAEYASGHIPRAVNIPMEEIVQRMEDLDPARQIVLVCESGNRAGMVKETHFAGSPNVTVLAGGTKKWREAGKPVVQTQSSGPIPLMRQVQIGAGAFIILGFALAWLVNPFWLVLPLFVGCGLIFAGVTGYCGMAIILQSMPWNNSSSIMKESLCTDCREVTSRKS